MLPPLQASSEMWRNIHGFASPWTIIARLIRWLVQRRGTLVSDGMLAYEAAPYSLYQKEFYIQIRDIKLQIEYCIIIIIHSVPMLATILRSNCEVLNKVFSLLQQIQTAKRLKEKEIT